MLFGPSIIAMASLYLSATGLDSDDDRIVAELTDEDRHTLFGLQGLFVNREQVGLLLNAARNRIGDAWTVLIDPSCSVPVVALRF